MDLAALEKLVRELFASGVAERTRFSYSSAQRRYLAFCNMYQISPLPLTETSTCLFAAFLTHQGLKAQSISSYPSALCYLQVSIGLQATLRSEWPCLQYILKGIARCQRRPVQRRLPITVGIMRQLQSGCSSELQDAYESRLLWAACCLGYFGFMRAGEFTATSQDNLPTVMASDVAVDSHHSPSLLRVKLRRAKTDPFDRGVDIYFGRTSTNLCPMAAILHYLAICPAGEGALLVHADRTPLTREQFVRMVRRLLRTANVDVSAYSGHSFRIGAATAAAAAGVPTHFIKMLGRWESEAYQLYLRTPCESLSGISQLIAE